MYICWCIVKYIMIWWLWLNKRTKNVANNDAFTLPTVLISSVVMLIVLLAGMQLASVSASALREQYYNQLAREAAESGVVRAKTCLASNNDVAPWTDARKLKPNTDCKGFPTAGQLSYIQQYGTIRTTYEVRAPERSVGLQRTVVVGVTELIRRDGYVWKRYPYQLATHLGANTLISSIAFGYKTGADTIIGSCSAGGAFFSIIDEFNRVKAAGLNDCGQLGNGTTTNSTDLQQFLLPSGKKATRVFSNFLSVGLNMLVLTSDGEVYGAGENRYGQLGDGTTINRSLPVKFRLPAGKKAKYIAPLGTTTFVVTEDGLVYAAGRNAEGSAGVGASFSTNNVTTPMQVPLPEKVRGDDNSWAVDRAGAYVIGESGAVYGWGSNLTGQLAQGHVNNSNVPVKLGGFGLPGNSKAVKLVFDGDTVVIMDDLGVVYTAGSNAFGQAGTRRVRIQYGVARKDCLTAKGSKVLFTPCNNAANQEWTFEQGTSFLKATANPENPGSLCLDNQSGDGVTTRMLPCVSSYLGEKYHVKPIVYQNLPQRSVYDPVPGSKRFIDNVSVHITNDTLVGGNGRCLSGTAGQETKLDACQANQSQSFLLYRTQLTRVNFPSTGKVVDISTDEVFNSAVLDNGAAFTWGLNNGNGSLGNGVQFDIWDAEANKRKAYNPEPVRFAIPSTAKAIATWTTSNGWNPNTANTYIVTSDGRVYGSGSNRYGQLGNGVIGGGQAPYNTYATPQLMHVLGADGNLAKYVRSGFGTTVIYTANGKIFTVGNNSNGQLGDGTTVNSPIPKANKNTNIVKKTLFY